MEQVKRETSDHKREQQSRLEVQGWISDMH